MKKIFLDPSPSDGRGGSVYLKRMKDYLGMKGEDCILIGRSNYKYSFDFRITWYILASWFLRYELRGNAPWFLIAALFSRRAGIYVGTPVSRWSRRSKWLFTIVCRLRSVRIMAASMYVRRECLEYVGSSVTQVSYAKIIDPGCQKNILLTSECRVVLVVMAAGDKSKGWEDTLTIARSIRSLKPVVVVYGSCEMETLSDLNDIEVYRRGFKKNPFTDLRQEFPGEMYFYVGMSEYEGLHMAVVEAGLEYIPVLLSDIPAHRELEKVSGESLLIMSSAEHAVSKLIEIVNNRDRYCDVSEVYRRMASRFVMRANKAEIDE